MIFPFSRPLMLVFLAVPLWLLIRAWHRSQGRLVLPFDHAGTRSSRVLGAAVNLAESLPPFLLAVAILLLAGPQQLGEPQSRRGLTNIEFCVDISGSMTTPFGGGTRYDAAMEAINRFVDYRKGDAFGLTFFGNSVLHWVPLTSDVSAIKCATPFMRPERNIPGFGGTEIGKALLACRKVLADREEGDRMIVLVTDGFSADLFRGRDLEVAKELKNSHVVVHAIHIAETNVPGEIANITGITGGAVYAVDDPHALDEVFQKIDQMQQTKMVQLSPDTLDDFRPYCMAGLSLAGLATLSLFGLRFTPW
jgi:Ca-activated chloride channel family protein